MNRLTGGFLGYSNQVENWLNVLFEYDASNPGVPIEHPDRLVFASLTDGADMDQDMRNSLYSFDKIKEAFFLHKICQPPQGGESIVKALADNFLIHAYALWNFSSATERSQFMREQATVFQQNSNTSERIGSLPFCRISQPGQNEIFLFEGELRRNADLQLALQGLQTQLASQQTLLEQAAEQRIVLEQSLEVAQSATEKAVAQTQAFANERYQKLQIMTDALIADANAGLLESNKEFRRELDTLQVQSAKEVANLQKLLEGKDDEFQSRLAQVAKLYENQMQEIRKSNEKQVDLANKECQIKLQSKDAEYKADVTSKLSIVNSTHKEQMDLLQMSLQNKERELLTQGKSMEKLKEEFKMLSTHVIQLQDKCRNQEEGIQIRDALLSNARTELETMQRDLRSELDRVRSESNRRIVVATERINSLTVQLASEQLKCASELENEKANMAAQCDVLAAKQANQSTMRLKENGDALRESCRAELREMKMANTQHERALVAKYQASNSEGGNGGCTIV